MILDSLFSFMRCLAVKMALTTSYFFLLGKIFKRSCTGAYLGFCQGGCTFLADLTRPPDLDLDPDPHQDLELDPDPHQNNADPQPWAQLSNDCCLIYNYI